MGGNLKSTSERGAFLGSKAKEDPTGFPKKFIYDAYEEMQMDFDLGRLDSDEEKEFVETINRAEN